MKTLFNLALFASFLVISLISASQEKNENAKKETISSFCSNVHVVNSPSRGSVGPFSIYELRGQLRDSSSNSAASGKENSDGERPPQYFAYGSEDEMAVPSSEEERPPEYFCPSMQDNKSSFIRWIIHGFMKCLLKVKEIFIRICYRTIINDLGDKDGIIHAKKNQKSPSKETSFEDRLS